MPVEVVVAPVVVAKKVKAPTLSAKYSRFMAFGNWFLSQQSELVSEELLVELNRKLMIFASIEEQTAFYEDFLSQLTATNKTIRKMVAVSKKPVKAPKAPRAKKSKAALPQDGLVAQLIADANGPDVEPVAEATPAASAEKKPKAPRAKKVKAPVVPADEGAPAEGAPVVEAPVAEKKQKAPRAKKVKTTEPVVASATEPTAELVAEPVVASATEPTAELVVEPVEKTKKSKKTDKAEKADKADKADKPKKTKKTKAEPVAAVDESVEEDINARIVCIEEKDYLIDNENNLYGVEPPHSQVGTYNEETGKAALF
jgi:hypothetical protein